ncbi:nitrilase [Bacillus sp. SD075]|uniref:nitrilase-related carbon-nitrogen hydrolase n=1 Tax=Bacillus sp. SD075 TaxID=2781732 RepID=UPI001A971AC0|nr:nitrilase-related carbon-nitrogen hydrolase [Bacillus sp. SD075]MBO0996612.1 nitrilase [Bacillus sp. SD075]
MGIKHPFKTAVIEFNPQLNQLDNNLDNLLEAVTEAAKNGAKLIVTPEMATTGYHYENRQSILPFTDTIPGKTTNRFEEVAKLYGTHIVIGMAEVDGEDGLCYNSAALVGPKGYIGKYRKVHQWATEDNWAHWGDLGIPVYETSIGRIAIIICMDSTYFESARIVAVKGADILCFPTNSTGGSLSMLQAWAEMNGLYVIGANRSNTETDYHMVGASAVWSPLGRKIAETPYVEESQARDETVILYADIDPELFENPAKKRMEKRKPGLYSDLMLHDGPWENKTSINPLEQISTENYEKRISTALLQYEPVIGDKKENLKKIKRLLADAAVKAKEQKSELSLVICPELSLTGPVHSLSPEEILKLSEPIHGVTVKDMRRLSAEYQIKIIFGMIEREENLLYNTVVLLTPEEDRVIKARKIHLSESDERWASAGWEIVVANVTDIGRVGLIVGSDATFPEVAGIIAVKHADVIIIPSCWYGEFGEILALPEKMMENKFPFNSMTTWDATARFSQTKTFIANFIGTDIGCKGGSALYTPDPIYGSDMPVVASSQYEAVLMVVNSKMEQNGWFDQHKLLRSRRPIFYRPLVKKIKM